MSRGAVAAFLFVALLFGVFEVTAFRQARSLGDVSGKLEKVEATEQERCTESNVARQQVNVRGEVLVSFLREAERTRRIATVDVPSNVAAADRYRELAAQVTPLPYRDCDDDGKADVPPELVHG